MAKTNFVICLVAVYSVLLVMSSAFGHSHAGAKRIPLLFLHVAKVPGFMQLLDLVKQAKEDGSDFRRQFVGADGKGGEYFAFRLHGYQHKTYVYLDCYRDQKDACLVGFKATDDETNLVIPLNEDHLVKLLKLILDRKWSMSYEMDKLPDHQKRVICDLWHSMIQSKLGLTEDYDYIHYNLTVPVHAE